MTADVPLFSQAHRSFCDDVRRPPRYLYNNIGLTSVSSRQYFSALLEELLVLSLFQVGVCCLASVSVALMAAVSV